MGIPCTGRNNMVAIGSTIKERAPSCLESDLAPTVTRVRAHVDREKVGFPTN